jgi:signal transduction histidine kinase
MSKISRSSPPLHGLRISSLVLSLLAAGMSRAETTELQLRVTSAPALPAHHNSGTEWATNVAQLRQWAGGNQIVECNFRLRGSIVWSSARRDRLVLQDDSGAIPVVMDLRGRPALQPGRQVTLAGHGTAAFGVLREAALDNDGLHPPQEKAGTVWLSAGRHPFQLDWFNGPETYVLQVDYAGPGLPRQRIPVAAFWRCETNALGAAHWMNGVDYQGFEGKWDRLPEFANLPAVKSGTAANLTLDVRSRNEWVGLRFTGCLEVTNAGAYTFWLKSDDGSRLILDASAFGLDLQGSGPAPAPRHVAPDESPASNDSGQWVKVEGTVILTRLDPSGQLEVDLNCGTNHLQLEVEDATGPPPPLFSRIGATGICHDPWPAGGRPGPWLSVPALDQIQVSEEKAGPGLGLPTISLAQLRLLETNGLSAPVPVRLEGLVRAANSDLGLLTLQDRSGAALIEMDLHDSRVRPGNRVVLEGYAFLLGARVRLRNPVLVDNDATHTAQERTGALFLDAGKHSIRLSWFNAVNPCALEVWYQGPGVPRQRIPDAALFHAASPGAGQSGAWAPGLEYRCYRGAWLRVPNTSLLTPVKRGTTPNFDVRVAGWTENLAMEFEGFLEVQHPGLYFFSTVSDDGSLLTIDEQPPRLEVVGDGRLSEPKPVTIGQALPEEQNNFWSQVEGLVSFASPRANELDLELAAGSGRLRVQVVDGSLCSPSLLLRGRIKAEGICQSTRSLDGQNVAGVLLAPSANQIELLEVDSSAWEEHPVHTVAHLCGLREPPAPDELAHVRGKMYSSQPGESFVLADGTGPILVESGQRLLPPDGTQIEALGRWSRNGTNVLLRGGFCREIPAVPSLPLLTTVDQVKRLSRAEAERGYPVKIRGVVTTILDSGFFIQDATWGIYARWWPPAETEPPRVGDYWEVEGTTFVEFAPNIRVRRASRLGVGTLPEPLHPTWDQLINGSLDTQFVEVQGVVTAVESDVLSILTPAGKIRLHLDELDPQTLRHYENARIRVRGCVIPERDTLTQQVELGQIRLVNVSVNVDEPPPADLFSTSLKSASDLLFFDSRAGAIQRVRVKGQILHERDGEFYLRDGTNGLRFLPKAPVNLRVGDLVEVAGFAKLGGPSPVLREAVVRRVGHAELPEPRPLRAEALLGPYDATRVRIQARLISVGWDPAGQALELQAGGRGFVARLARRDGRLPQLMPGSRLELTGVYAGLGGDPASGRNIDSFELLLNSPLDLLVLEHPSWWTFRHTLAVLGALVAFLLAALFWITLLQRRVEERSRQLATEIRRHEQTERQRELEEERARIARDLHDDLGATLTQIRLLSALESRDALVPENTRARMRQVSEKSREMVTSLDEIVWAVNPANDSLPSLATYLCLFAEEFFRPTPIRCRLDVDDALPPAPLTSEVRHDLYLVVREAINNIAKHSQATEVWLRIQWEQHGLGITVEDNGCGFSLASHPPGEGLANMRRRVEKIGGRLTCDTRIGSGTVCRIWLPIEPVVNAQPGVLP